MPTQPETVRTFAERLALEALAERYSRKHAANEAFDRLEDRAAWERGEDYEVERYRPRTMEEAVEDVCMVTEQRRDDDEGFGTYIRALTYREVVDTVVARLVERGVIQAANVSVGSRFLCGEIKDGRICFQNLGPASRCPTHGEGATGRSLDDATQACEQGQRAEGGMPDGM